MLSDTDIYNAIARRDIEIKPVHSDNIGPDSYDVHLAKHALLPLKSSLGEPLMIDPSRSYDNAFIDLTLPDYNDEGQLPFYIHPGETLLGATLEGLALNSRSIAADISGCSGLARWFILVHATAGFVDSGWGKGLENGSPLTVELVNIGPFAIRLWSGMRIGQLRFWRTESPVNCMYDERRTSEYTSALGPQQSHYHIGAGSKHE